MRVPSIGLTLDERRITREGYRLAERLLRNYRDPPNAMTMATTWLAQLARTLDGANRGYRRD